MQRFFTDISKKRVTIMTAKIKTTQPNNNNLKYGDAVKKLQTIVEGIENNSYDIDVLTEKIEEAVGLISFCKEKLKNTEESVEKIFALKS